MPSKTPRGRGGRCSRAAIRGGREPPTRLEVKKRAFAGFWRRLLAWLIDAVLLWCIGFVITMGVLVLVPPSQLPAVPLPVGLADADRLGVSTLIVRVDALVSPVLFFIGWAYYALMESSPSQGTVGKMALGLYVTDMFGDPISFSRASLRWWFKLLSSWLCMLGWLMAAFTPQKQALHDVLARTVVLRNVLVPAPAPGEAPEPGEYWDGRRWQHAVAALDKR